MKINNINNSHLYNTSKNSAVKKNEEQKEVTDSINISKQARELAENNKKLESVKQKIGENFYNRDEVISKTADAILKELYQE